jgi:hypothetical protein
MELLHWVYRWTYRRRITCTVEYDDLQPLFTTMLKFKNLRDMTTAGKLFEKPLTPKKKHGQCLFSL